MTATPAASQMEAPERLLNLAQVCERTSLSKSMINRLRGEGKFVVPAELGLRRIGFPESEVNTWVAQRKAARLRQDRMRQQYA